MDLVEDFLVIGIAVDGGHQATLDTDGVVQNFRERRKAVGGAACVGNNHVCSGQNIVVDPENDGFVDIFPGCRNQHALGARSQMLFGTGTIREETGAFQRNIHAIGGVRQICRVTLGSHMNALAVDDDVIAIRFDGAGEWAMHAVALEKQGIRLCRRQIVDGDQFQVMVVALKYRTSNQTADAAKSVNSYFDSHICSYQPNLAMI